MKEISVLEGSANDVIATLGQFIAGQDDQHNVELHVIVDGDKEAFALCAAASHNGVYCGRITKPKQ